MTFATGTRNDKRRPHGFTLIELILVMAMLLIVLGVVFPSLKGFFQGRHLDSEAGRFLSLTRYGQSRAVSEGVPMDLWLDVKQGIYGLEAQSGYTLNEKQPLQFQVDQTVQLSVSTPPTTLTQSNYWTPTAAQKGSRLAIHFQPDGFISDTSPEQIFFRQGPDEGITIVENATHQRYEMQTR